MTTPSRPLPTVSPLAQPFWDACAEGRLVIQRCSECDRLRHYPQELCPNCQSSDYDWSELSGRGSIYSYTISHRAFHPAWKDRVPYAVVTVELDEGVRMVSELMEADPSDVEIDRRVEVSFRELEGFGLAPFFVLA